MKNFQRPARGTYVVSVPVTFTRKDVMSSDWPNIRYNLIHNATGQVEQAIYETENAIYAKK